MSKLAARAKAQEQDTAEGLFAVIAGQRFDGKSTLAGTLPGRTLMLQAKVLETGSKSAQTLARQRGNDLSIITFESLDDLVDLIEDFRKDDYDNLYIDGLSAITEMKYTSPEVQKILQKDNWGAFRIVADSARSFLKFSKSVGTDSTKRVFVTMAMTAKRDANGHLVELIPNAKGNVATAEVSRLCPVFVTLRTRYDDQGLLIRELITKSTDVYPGRIDTLLDDQNPGVIDADLSKLLELIKQ